MSVTESVSFCPSQSNDTPTSDRLETVNERISGFTNAPQSLVSVR
ncbi:Uncharacterised protein [Vibrio cholerae]|nr:Uncharacterised protein [Vibrio cholerae]